MDTFVSLSSAICNAPGRDDNGRDAGFAPQRLPPVIDGNRHAL